MYIKSKVNQTTMTVQPGSVLNGELLNAEWLNHVQTQYQKFLDDNVAVYGQFLCLINKIVTPSGNLITLDGPIIGNPFVFIDGKMYNSREESEEFDLASGFLYKYGEKQLTGQSVPMAGRVCNVYYYSVLNHAETHWEGGLDPINISNLNAYNRQEIDALFFGVIGESGMEDRAKSTKSSGAVGLCIRELNNNGDSNEFYDSGLILGN